MANGNQLALPESVRRQIETFRRGLWLAETLAAVFGGIAMIFGAYLLLFISDRLWDTPIWLRIAITLIALAGIGGWTWFWLQRWTFHKRDDRQMALLVQRHFPKLGDRLLGIVELSDPQTRPGNVSEKLCEAAMRQVAGETSHLDFTHAVSKKQERRWGTAFAALGALALLALVILPLAGVNVWQRLLNPFGGANRYTLAKLEGLPAEHIVPYGEPFTLHAAIATNSEWTPTHATGRFVQQAALDVLSDNRAFTFHVPSQTANGTFTVRAGDARNDVRVTPLYRPELVQLQAVVDLPDYLGYGTVTQDVRRGSVDLLSNSKFSLAGRASRELTSIMDGVSTGRIDGARFTMPEREALVPATTTLQWEDIHGLRAKENFKLKLNVVEDESPNVDCRGLQHIIAILDDEVLEFEAFANDDYGVRELGLSWIGGGSPGANVPAATGDVVVATGGQQMRELIGKVYFSPKAQHIGPQRLELHATAVDYKPNRLASQSPPYYVIILDKTEHAKLVQKELDRLVEKLEEINRTEQSLLERNEQIKRDMANSKDPKENAEHIAEQEQAERRNTEEMQKLQEDLQKLTKEALRNNQINEDAVAKWAEMIPKLSQTAKQTMPSVSKSLSKSQSSNSKSDQQNQMNEAMRQQEQALKEMAQALKEMNQSGEMMQAGNFVARLRKMSNLEAGIGKDLEKLLPDTIGVPVEEIPISLRVKTHRLADQQYQAQVGVQTLRDEMGSFVTRTQEERYRNVHDDMVTSKIVEDLSRLTDQLDQKISQNGIEGSQKWSAQLEEWAARLQPKKPGGGGGTGGGGGGGEKQVPPEVIEAMMKLMRVRFAEEDLRNHTRGLEARRKDATYAKNAESLSDQQGEFRTDVADAGTVLKEAPGVPELLAKVDTAMKDASFILARPQTDLEAVSAETEVIELLTDLLDKAAQQCNKSGNAAGMMAMMQAMQQQMQASKGNNAGQTPGGNTNGGVTDRDNIPNEGDAKENSAEHRKVDKGAGPDLNKVPAEFREALQAYFEKVDKL